MYILVQNIAASWIKTRAQKLADPTLTLLFYICPENVWVKYNGTWHLASLKAGFWAYNYVVVIVVVLLFAVSSSIYWDYFELSCMFTRHLLDTRLPHYLT